MAALNCVPKQTKALTAEYLRSIVLYDADTGIFAWKQRPVTHHCHIAWNTQWAGKPVVVTVAKDPHNPKRLNALIRISAKYHSVGRLVWLYTYGCWPRDEIDHRNGDPLDNKLRNLRDATHAQNQRNTGAQANNRLGVKGVTYRAERKGQKKFYAQMKIDGRVRFIGWFASCEDAADAYRQKAIAIHGEFLHSSLQTP